MKNSKVKWLSLLIILSLIWILYSNLFKGRSEKVKYGKPANVIRENVKVPIIGSDMRRIRMSDNVVGGQWDGKDEGNGIVHFRKIVSPNSDIYILDKESDILKKYKDKDVYWQLNVYSKILGDSVSIRKGGLWLRCNGCANSEQSLDENGLDSVFKKWGLKDLVKKDGF